MTESEESFHKIIKEIPEAIEGKMFGTLCIKSSNGKVAALFWKDDMQFKLGKIDLENALNLKGTRMGFHLYAPEKPMKGWIYVPKIHAGKWADLTKKAIEYVRRLEK